MTTKMLKDVLTRVERWPESAQDELAEIALAIDADLKGAYQPTAEELAGIRRGLRAADAGRFATEEVTAVFAKFHRK